MYKVTCNRWYGAAPVYYSEYFFRWYWAANAWSWFMHHVGGYECHTFKKDIV